MHMPRTVALAGATGLVGREILRGLVADPQVFAIHVLTRRAVAGGDAKVTAHIAASRICISIRRLATQAPFIL
jgi:aspartate-semialdehyde dehydrogenase